MINLNKNLINLFANFELENFLNNTKIIQGQATKFKLRYAQLINSW